MTPTLEIKALTCKQANLNEAIKRELEINLVYGISGKKYILKLFKNFLHFFFFNRTWTFKWNFNYPVNIPFLDSIFFISTNESVEQSEQNMKETWDFNVTLKFWNMAHVKVMIEELLPWKCIMSELTRLFFSHYKLVKHARMKRYHI